MAKATVFIGDLSRFCSDEDISSLFHRYGKVLETKIMRNPVTGISLGYGFLIMGSTESAFLAMQNLHGVQLRGRPLRVKWAGRNIKSDSSVPSVTKSPRDSPAEVVINSVHVRFQALHISSCLFTEESLYQFFMPFGEVTDASIKESNVDETTGLQHGYGFVHFNSSPDGAQSAFRAITELSGDCFFSLHCEGSRNFMKQFNGAQALSAPPSPKSSSPSTPTQPRSPSSNYHTSQSLVTIAKSRTPQHREFAFQSGSQPYYSQPAITPSGSEPPQAYFPTPYMNTPSNILPNPMYHYTAIGQFCPAPTSDINLVMPPSAFPTRTAIPTYTAYDSYAPNYTYFPVPLHMAIHPHLIKGTAGPTAKPSYLSYSVKPAARMPGHVGTFRGSTSSKDDSTPPHQRRPEDKTYADKRAFARSRSINKTRLDMLPTKHVAQGIGETGEPLTTTEALGDTEATAYSSKIVSV